MFAVKDWENSLQIEADRLESIICLFIRNLALYQSPGPMKTTITHPGLYPNDMISSTPYI